MLPLHGRLVSQHKSEYAGPCPFTGLGDDRFHWWAGSNNWWCRHDCPNCPGEICATGGRKGFFDDGETRSFRVLPPADLPTMTRVYEYQERLDGQVLSYLANRGIRRETASKFLVGKNCRRLTVPNVVRNGHLVCYGIKKRWVGKPPEDWIDKYTMEPGSRGKSIFNYNRLASRRSWPYVAVVEGILDCMLLDQLGVPAIAPFGGGGVWDTRWAKALDRAREVVFVADDDPDGQGFLYAQKKQQMLGRGQVVFPPGGCKDIGEAYKAGEKLPAWFTQIAGG